MQSHASTIQASGEPALLTLPEIAVTRTRPTDICARTAGPRVRPVGRDDVVSRVLDACSRSATPAVMLTGPAGIGRSTVLAQVHEKLTELGVSTTRIRIPSAGFELPHIVATLADGLGLPPARGASSQAALTRLLAALTRRRDRHIVLLDDAHRLTPDARAVVTSSINALAGTQVTFVYAARTSAADPGPDVDALRAGGLVHERLRPLSRSAVEQVLTDLFGAKPAPGLAASIRNASRGIPAVVRAAVEGFEQSGALRIVGRQAHLLGEQAPQLPSTHPLFKDLYRLGAPSWPVLKALAVLHPLRGDLPALIAEAVGITEEAVLETLHELRATGVVLPGQLSGSWRFRVPMVATLLTTCLGPFEQRRTSRLAVTAMWDGSASCADDNYLPDRLVDSGRLADQERAAANLLAASAQQEVGELADRWLWGASRLHTDPARRAATLHQHAVTCALNKRFGSATQSADVVLRGLSDQLSPESLLDLQLAHVVGLASSGNKARLRDLAQDGWQSMPGGEANRGVIRAAALCMLNRWQEAGDQLSASCAQRDEGAAAVFRRFIAHSTGTLAGNGPIPGNAGAQAALPSGTTADMLRMLVRTLSLGGWLDVPGQETPMAPTIEASFSGRWDDALDLARSELASASLHGHGPEQTAVYREATMILTARGQLDQARAVLDDARSQQLLLPHLLAVAEAELERTLGGAQRSKELVEQAIALATESGVVAGTDELWLLLTESESQSGNPASARRCAARIERIAERLDTPGARRSQLLARLLIQPDPVTAEQVIDLARARNRPFELACTIAAVAECGYGNQELIRTAYEMFGDLDALIPRARLRRLMRTRSMTVPGRSVTVAENERLLAALVAEGLTNSQLATVLGTSEKSVEGRLTRFFNRTGYRSRTELATATLTCATPHQRPRDR